MPFTKAVRQYLHRHAEEEALIVEAWQDRYTHAIAMPACNEKPSLSDCFSNPALPPLLVVVVVNGGEAHDQQVHSQNAATFSKLQAQLATPQRHNWGVTGLWKQHRLVLIDRFSPTRRMRPKTGVGLARKIVCDVALAAWAQDKVASPWIRWADADIVMPADLFDVQPDARAVAAIYPFEHVPCGEDSIDEAHRLYECYLRYHRLGMAAAGSPYAYHAIGSIMAVHAAAYAAVRGVPPKRTAGEDFYTLNKLAKLGPVAQLAGSPVAIRSRRSLRVPFGTGPAVAKIEALQGDYVVYDPKVYKLLKLFHRCLDVLAARPGEPSAAAFLAAEAELPTACRKAWRFAMAQCACAEQADRALANGSPRRRECLSHHFDALRSLKLIHAFRDGGLADLPLAQALSEATFCPGAEPTAEGTLTTLRQHERNKRPGAAV